MAAECGCLESLRPFTMYIYILWRVPNYDITSMEMDKSTGFLRATLSNRTSYYSISKVTSEAFDLGTKEGTFKASRLPQLNAPHSDLPGPVQ